MKRNAKMFVVLAVATVAIGGAAWLAAQSGDPVGTGLSIKMLASPT